MKLKYTPSGYLYITPDDDCKAIVDAMLMTNYSEEFCVAMDFSIEFVIRLMEAGFLIMSTKIPSNVETVLKKDPGSTRVKDDFYYLLLPKLHLVRSALFFDNLHIKKSIRKYMNRYELKADTEFDRILNRCLEKHGQDWLTPPLVDCIRQIRNGNDFNRNPDTEPALFTGLELSPVNKVYPSSFGLYRDGELVAGEFGIVYGNVYTSYSGYFDEDNAGTVQIILTTRYLQEHGFSFFDLGMPLDYKNDLGAVDITPYRFVQLFRMGNKVRRSIDFK